MKDPGSIPRGVLMWNWDSPVSVVLLHWWSRHDLSLWSCLRWASSQTVTRQSCWQCDNHTWSHAALLSRFHARCRSSFLLHNRIVSCWGGALWRACNLTAFIHSSTGPVVHPFASGVKDPGYKPLGGTCVKPGFPCLHCLATVKVKRSAIILRSSRFWKFHFGVPLQAMWIAAILFLNQVLCICRSECE